MSLVSGGAVSPGPIFMLHYPQLPQDKLPPPLLLTGPMWGRGQRTLAYALRKKPHILLGKYSPRTTEGLLVIFVFRCLYLLSCYTPLQIYLNYPHKTGEGGRSALSFCGPSTCNRFLREGGRPLRFCGPSRSCILYYLAGSHSGARGTRAPEQASLTLLSSP